MLAHQRHDEILRQVNSNGSVRVTDLVTELGVSEMTVRRDISLLAN
ncbi:DeoR family transcriptional regulator [Varibaculum cambriense]|nr:DeoR family transcriptional regulator [Varibaculum cambriense]MDU1683508.1 DeoR family transcriptional regulator [Varibaculum cambriense]